METYTIKRDNERAIKFTGEKIAGTSSSPDRAMGSNYIGPVGGRWTELRLYRTKDRKYICEEVGHTQWRGERDRRSGAVCDDVNCVTKFFGHGWLANALYANAKIEDSVD